MNTIRDLLSYKGIFISDPVESSKLRSNETVYLFRDEADNFDESLLLDIMPLAQERTNHYKVITRELAPGYLAIAKALRRHK